MSSISFPPPDFATTAKDSPVETDMETEPSAHTYPPRETIPETNMEDVPQTGSVHAEAVPKRYTVPMTSSSTVGHGPGMGSGTIDDYDMAGGVSSEEGGYVVDDEYETSASKRSARHAEPLEGYYRTFRGVRELDRSQWYSRALLEQRGQNRKLQGVAVKYKKGNKTRDETLAELRRQHHELAMNHQATVQLLTTQNTELAEAVRLLNSKVTALQEPRDELESTRLQLQEEYAELQERSRALEKDFQEKEVALTRRESALEHERCQLAEKVRRHELYRNLNHEEDDEPTSIFSASNNGSRPSPVSRPANATPASPSPTTHRREFFKPTMQGRRSFRTTVEPASDSDVNDDDDDDEEEEEAVTKSSPARPGKTTEQLDIPSTDIGNFVATVVSEVLGRLGVTGVAGGGSFGHGSSAQATKVVKKKLTPEGLRLKAAIREVYKEACCIEQDIDWLGHEPADEAAVRAYVSGGIGPDPRDLRFDMVNGIERSPWNQRIFDILLDKLKVICASKYRDIPLPVDDILRGSLADKFSRGKGHWKKGQPLCDGNSVETEEERQKRVQAMYEKAGAKARANTRRQSKFKRRRNTCAHELKLNVDPKDQATWRFLLRLINTLGSEGMSSDESCKAGAETIYRVKVLPWRRSMEDYMEIIDDARVFDQDLYSGSGSKPGKRIRDYKSTSLRSAVKKLPRPLYNDTWLEAQSEAIQRALCVSKEQFQWIRLIAKTAQGRA